MKYHNLTKVYDLLESTSKRLEKTFHIASLIENTEKENLEKIMLLLQGRIYHEWDERKIGVASRMALKAINIATGISPSKIENEWKKTGDLGKVAENLTKIKKQETLFSQELTVNKVFNNLRKLTELEGLGAVDKKLKLIAELLTSAKPIEARYIIRTVLEELRVGIGSGSMRDAIVWSCFPLVKGVFFRCDSCHKWMPKTPKCLNCRNDIKTKFSDADEKNCLKLVKAEELFNSDLHKYEIICPDNEKTAREAYILIQEAVQHAIDLTNDFSVVVSLAREKGLKGLISVDLRFGKPIKVMLAQKVKDMKEGFERVNTPAELEYKYDGFRMQIHKSNGIKIYTRRLEDVTAQFPEVVKYIKEHIKGESFILDSEAVGFDPKTGHYLPFQSISQRIKRKYNIDEMSRKFPVEVNIFDIVSYEGKNLLKVPFNKRRALLEKIVNPDAKRIVLAKSLITSDLDKANAFYEEALKKGNEGIMLKNLEGTYKPGSRVGFMVKLKPSMETLDLVITRAEWGEGKRATWLTSFTISCVKDGRFLEIGKVGTGIKELEGEGVTFNQLTELLRPLITEEKGKSVKVKPKIVIEIQYEEIQASPTYSSGYALRFPRLVKIREDLSPEDISSLDLVKEFYDTQ